MAKSNLDPRIELDFILEVASEEIISSTDAEFIQLERAKGRDLGKSADRMRGLFTEVLHEFRRRKLRAAKELHLAEQDRIQKGNYNLPAAAEERRGLLQHILDRFPEYLPALTFQNREFKTFTDDDIEASLRRFAELGILEKIKSGESK